MIGVIILSLLIFVIVDLFIFPVFMEVAHVGILHANPVMQHACFLQVKNAENGGQFMHSTANSQD